MDRSDDTKQQSSGRRGRGAKKTKAEQSPPTETTPEPTPKEEVLSLENSSDPKVVEDDKSIPPRQPSVVDFNRDEVRELESKKVSELGLEDVLKLLIVRGEDQKNPIVSGGCERLLRQINRERIGGGPRPKRGYGGMRGPPPGMNNNYRSRGFRRRNNPRNMTNNKNVPVPESEVNGGDE